MASMNFLDNLREILTQEIFLLGYSVEAGSDLYTIAIQYFDLKRRIPPNLKWTVKQSKNLAIKPLSRSIRSGLDKFIKQAETGKNLKPYLSIQIDNPNYRDLMFYDWGIFHFHLGTKPHRKYKGFIERTDDLLFSVADFSTASMYLIDIHPHKRGFTNKRLLEKIEDNWPQILDPYTLSRVKHLIHNVSSDDISDLRKSYINPIIQTSSGRTLRPMGGGVTTTGSSRENKIRANRAIERARELEKKLEEQKLFIESKFKAKHNKNWEDLTFKLICFELPARVKETTTFEVIEIQDLFSKPIIFLEK